MLAVNALLFVTSLLEKMPSQVLIGVGLLLASVGLAVLAVAGSNAGSNASSNAWMYLGVSLTSADTGLVLPVIAYLAAAAGLGQTFGSAAGGWLLSVLAHHSFASFALPLVAMLVLLFLRLRWWLVPATAANVHHSRPGT